MTSVVNLHMAEPRHPKAMELWPQVRSLVADLTAHLRSGLACDTQVSSNPQAVASPVGNVLASCSTSDLVAWAVVAQCRDMLRQGV
jgi:hypothetical protein